MNLVFPLIEFAWIDLGDIMVPGTATIANNAPSIFGFGAVKQLSAAMKGLDISRPLICTDAGIVACGLIERVLTELSEIPTIFADTPPNPDETAVYVLAEMKDPSFVKSFGERPDIVAIREAAGADVTSTTPLTQIDEYFMG